MSRLNPFRYFKTSPEIIRLAVMMWGRSPLSLRNVEDLLHERGIDVSHETVRFWWNRFGLMFAAEIRRKRTDRMRAFSNWQWHVDEAFVKINGERHYLWRAVDHRLMRSLQKFVAVHSSVYNHFNQERSLSSRDIFNLNRTAALTEWRQLGAA